jgi:hypothetical protein|tara:strand:- start:1377 stop:1742 length:366 start_codon:yes stop_codon:yes gene_type:complete
MFIRILCLALGITFLTGGAYAQEKEENNVSLAPMNLNITGLCAPTKDFNKAQKDENILFMGILNEITILKLSQDKNGFWSIIVQTANGISCMYFGGPAGTASNTLQKKEPRRKINGQYVYN